jgi:hypothetical protein
MASMRHRSDGVPDPLGIGVQSTSAHRPRQHSSMSSRRSATAATALGQRAAGAGAAINVIVVVVIVVIDYIVVEARGACACAFLPADLFRRGAQQRARRGGRRCCVPRHQATVLMCAAVGAVPRCDMPRSCCRRSSGSLALVPLCATRAMSIQRKSHKVITEEKKKKEENFVYFCFCISSERFVESVGSIACCTLAATSRVDTTESVRPRIASIFKLSILFHFLNLFI